jgi:Uncharacterized protein conserved in bacteria
MKNYLFVFLFAFSSFFACSKDDTKHSEDNNQEIPIEIEKPDEPMKPIQMWIDVHANFSRFAGKSNITSYMEKMKETGFNEIYVDVKPGIGYALYDSDILPQLTKWGTETVNRDWDYLAFWIEEAERLDMNVIASLSVTGYGDTNTKEGLVYDDNSWDGKTQMEMPDNNPEHLVDIRDQAGPSAALDPSLPEVQSFIISIIEEIATKYPKLKGICLDYCRWEGANYGFGDATIEAFEAYSGLTVSNKNDIITSTGGIGPLYSQWIEFRSMTITNLITNIRSKVKSINPELELHLWASAHWSSRYTVGQNWASKEYKPTASGIYTETYNKTGFADQIDVFSLGAYADHVWRSENPSSDWTVENFVTTYSAYTMGDCKVYGSIGTYAYGNRDSAVSDAVYLCLKNTDGLMVFEISHVINNNQWNAIKEGIGRVYK